MCGRGGGRVASLLVFLSWRLVIKDSVCKQSQQQIHRRVLTSIIVIGGHGHRAIFEPWRGSRARGMQVMSPALWVAVGDSRRGNPRERSQGGSRSGA